MKFKKKNQDLYLAAVELKKHIDECSAKFEDLRKQLTEDMKKRHKDDTLVVEGAEFMLRKNNKYKYSKDILELEDKVEKMGIILRLKKAREVERGLAKAEGGTYVLVMKITK